MFWKTLFFLSVLVLVFPSVARAYVDPGSGSLLLQVALAGLLGLAFTLRLYWNKLCAALKRLFARNRSAAEPIQTSHEEKR